MMDEFVEPEANVEVLRHKKRDEYLLIHFAIDPEFGAPCAYGEPETLTRSTMQTIGVAKVLASLEEFPRRDTSRTESFYRETNLEKRRQRQNDYLYIEVERIPGDTLRIVPLHRVASGGHTSDTERTPPIELTLPCSPEYFFQCVERAFAMIE